MDSSQDVRNQRKSMLQYLIPQEHGIPGKKILW